MLHVVYVVNVATKHSVELVTANNQLILVLIPVYNTGILLSLMPVTCATLALKTISLQEGIG